MNTGPKSLIVYSELDRKKKNDELLEAIYSGDIEKVLYHLRELPTDAKHNIVYIVQACKKPQNINSFITPLIGAITYGNYHLCKLLIEAGEPVRRQDASKPCPLVLAFEQNEPDIVLLLIQSGADVKSRDKGDGCSYPIYWAIHNKFSPEIVDQLILAGYPVNKPIIRPARLRAIHLAANVNNIEAAKVLVRHNADLNVLTANGETALTIAVGKNYQNMVEFLVNKGADLANKKSSICPIFMAIKSEHIKMVELLLKLGASISEGWYSEDTLPPLQFAIKSLTLNLDLIQLLLDKGVDVNGKHMISNQTVLHVLAETVEQYCEDNLRTRATKIARTLILKGADVNVIDHKGKTPLDLAIYYENDQLCKLFLTEGADTDLNGDIKDTIIKNRFEYMTKLNCPDLMNLCLERGADYNYRNASGLTPYHQVTINPEVSRVFWKHGCPFDQHDNSQMSITPNMFKNGIHLIQHKFINGIKCGNVDIVKRALMNGAEPRGGSEEVPSTLHYLAARGYRQIARTLLECGVPVNKVYNNKTPLQVAVEKGDLHTCKMLLAFGACYDCPESLKTKTIKTISKKLRPIYLLFKGIYKMFQFAKNGDKSLVTLLNRYKKSQQFLWVSMNCVNRRGLTLTGTAITMGYSDLASDLMAVRVKYMDPIKITKA